MSVTQVHEALGRFEFDITGNIPRDVLDTVEFFGHIAIIPGRMDPRQYGDGCLTAARYVGILRGKKIGDSNQSDSRSNHQLSGVGMEFWLGDEDSKGDVIEDETLFDLDTFSTVITALRPDALDNGTIYSVTGSYSGRHIYQSPRDAIRYVCQTMSTTAIPVGYRVTNAGALDAGPETNLFVTSPTCVIIRKGITQGEDMFNRALPSTLEVEKDMEDFNTRVLMLAESNGESLATGSADIATEAPGVNIYKDLNGNALKLTRMVSESDTIETNADTRAALALREHISEQRKLTVNTNDYDIQGSFDVGDYIYAYDPDASIYDNANETTIRGVRINPMKLRVTELVWPVVRGYTVAYRDANGVWTDLTDYVAWETSETTQVTIGDYSRTLDSTFQDVQARLGSITPPDTIAPDQVDWVVASFQTTNYNDSTGQGKARQKLVWNTPTNVGGSAITDGSHYELQYKLDSGSLYSQTWSAASSLTWDALNTWDQPVEPDDVLWQTLIVPWGETSTIIHELPVGTGFDSRIRAVDKGNNQGEWSATETWVTSEDNIPPSPPAAPVVAGSAIAIQVIHEMGMASGGTFNLESDLAYLDVHYSLDEGFTPSDVNLAGRLRANKGMMSAGTAAIGTFPIPETDAVYVKVVAVDTSGNRSNASSSSMVTAELIDSQYISELTASKITAGTFGADYLISGSIRTAEEGQRIELNSSGLQAYDADGDLTTNLSSDPLDTGEYISFRDTDGNTVASIGDTGDAAFANVYANTELYVAGDAMTDLLAMRPQGILVSTGLTGTSPGYTGTPILIGRIILPNVDGTRQYAIGMSNVHFDRGSNIDINRITIEVYAAYDTPATTSDTLLARYQEALGVAGYSGDQNISFRHPFAEDGIGGIDVHYAFYFSSEDVSGDLKVESTDGGRYYIEDCGPARTVGTFDLTTGGTVDGSQDGGEGSGGQEYVKTYVSTYTRSYDSGNDLRVSNGNLYQGDYDGTFGNQRSLIGFDYSTIQDDLAGATIVKVEIQLKNLHFYYNNSSAIIGSHDYNSAPSTWSGSRVYNNRVDYSWAKLAKKYVDLTPYGFGDDLKSGVAKGIAIGMGHDLTRAWYGYFAGQNEPTADRPTLRITYKK